MFHKAAGQMYPRSVCGKLLHFQAAKHYHSAGTSCALLHHDGSPSSLRNRAELSWLCNLRLFPLPPPPPHPHATAVTPPGQGFWRWQLTSDPKGFCITPIYMHMPDVVGLDADRPLPYPPAREIRARVSSLAQWGAHLRRCHPAGRCCETFCSASASAIPQQTAHPINARARRKRKPTLSPFLPLPVGSCRLQDPADRMRASASRLDLSGTQGSACACAGGRSGSWLRLLTSACCALRRIWPGCWYGRARCGQGQGRCGRGACIVFFSSVCATGTAVGSLF